MASRHNLAVLTIHEREQARRQAAKLLRKRLDERRPDRADFLGGGAEGRAARFVSGTLHYARAGVVIVTFSMLAASAIRNVTAVYENYTASGAAGSVAIIAALMFVIAVEAGIFIVALARAGIQAQRRADCTDRHVSSLRDLFRGLGVRLGVVKPRRHDQVAERDGLGIVLLLSFAFAVVANLAVGMGELWEGGTQTLQAHILGMTGAPASQQVRFILDLALALLPPALALTGGHLTARFAAEYSARVTQNQQRYSAALDAWRNQYNDPLDTAEGGEMLVNLLTEKAKRKAARNRPATPATAPLDPDPDPDFLVPVSDGDGRGMD